MVRFEDEQRLDRGANNLYQADEDMTPEPVEAPKIVQGMLEESNVQAITELSRMIEIQRGHQSLSRAIQQEHQRQMRAISKLTRRAAGA